jgi:hypothetical protein
MGYTKIKMWFNNGKWKAFWTHQTYPLEIQQLFSYFAQPLYVAFFWGRGEESLNIRSQSTFGLQGNG